MQPCSEVKRGGEGFPELFGLIQCLAALSCWKLYLIYFNDLFQRKGKERILLEKKRKEEEIKLKERILLDLTH